MSAATTKSKYPEHEKLKANEDKAMLIGSFIDFLREQGWELAEWYDKREELVSVRKRPDEIIGLFLGIDPKTLEKEKQAMLDEIRGSQQ